MAIAFVRSLVPRVVTFLGGGSQSALRQLGQEATRIFLSRLTGSRSSIVFPPVFRRFPVAADAIRPLERETAARLVRRIRIPDPGTGSRYAQFMKESLRDAGYRLDVMRCDHHVCANIFRGEKKAGSLTRVFYQDGPARRMEMAWIGSEERGLGNTIYRLDAQFAAENRLYVTSRHAAPATEHLFDKHFSGATTGLTKGRALWVPA